MRLVCALALVSLAACNAIGMNAGEPRQNAEIGARLSLQGTLPEEVLDAVANCVADNASNEEMETLITAGKGGVTGPSKALVQTILARPETQTCVADNNVSLDG